jgi:hypothetical protein
MAPGFKVAPATYNTINKWAQGISDTYPLSVLAELIGLSVPTVVVPACRCCMARVVSSRIRRGQVGERSRVIPGSLRSMRSRGTDRSTDLYQPRGVRVDGGSGCVQGALRLRWFGMARRFW